MSTSQRTIGTGNAWQRWFAWYPVRIEVCSPEQVSGGYLGRRVWLRRVETRTFEGHILMASGAKLPHSTRLYRLPRQEENHA